jgi:hypothetical protein
LHTNVEVITVNKPPLPNWTFIARSYDILYLNPYDLDDGAKHEPVFDFQATKPVPDTNFMQPPEVNHVPNPGTQTLSTTKNFFTSYDIQRSFQGGVKFGVSDVLGKLFSFTQNLSFKRRSQEIEEEEETHIFNQELVKTYGLRHNTKDKKLTESFRDLVEKIPADNSLQDLVDTFGTHYCREVILGGQATYTLRMERRKYLKMFEMQIDLKRQAEIAFDKVKVNSELSASSGLIEEFVESLKNQTEEIIYSGGMGYRNFDDWKRTIEAAPTPVYLELHPLYDLVNQQYFPDLPEDAIKEKRQALEEQIENYLTTGVNPSQSRIRYGDVLQLSIVTDQATKRYLSSKDHVSYTSTEKENSSTNIVGLRTASWHILPVDQKDMGEIVKVKDKVFLKNTSSDKYLDAQSGRDDEYYPGDGLTRADESHTTKDSVKWTVELAYNIDRDEIVEGDFVKLQTCWKNSDDEYGYLQGEWDPSEVKQRVFSFGNGRRDNGCYWKITKTSRV